MVFNIYSDKILGRGPQENGIYSFDFLSGVLLVWGVGGGEDRSRLVRNSQRLPKETGLGVNNCLDGQADKVMVVIYYHYRNFRLEKGQPDFCLHTNL